MATDTIYLLSSLPTLGHLGEGAPLSLRELVDKAGDHAAPDGVVGAIVLIDDLLQRGDVLAGRLEQPQPALLSPEQLRDEAPLPSYLLVESDQLDSPSQIAEAVWIAFFRHLLDVAHRRRCAFLKELVSFELTLRNALTAERARALDLTAEPIVVAADLVDEPGSVERIVKEWSTARTPLAGLQTIDHARWDWLEQHDRWFSFAIDELAAYAAKLTLLCRWERIADAIEAESHASASSQ
jgi:hypothetical protein